MKFHQKHSTENYGKAEFGWFEVERNVPNDSDAIITGDGNFEGGNKEWDEDVLLGNGNASGNISIPATDGEYCEDELITTIYQKNKMKTNNLTTVTVNKE